MSNKNVINATDELKSRMERRTGTHDTVFGSIARHESPANIIFEDDLTMAFHDKYPIAPVHFLVIPKERIEKFSVTEDSDSELLGRLLLTAKHCAKKLGIDEGGYRVVINNGAIACQTIFHLHLHVIGGKKLSPDFGCRS